jgi:hypothetical protein
MPVLRNKLSRYTDLPSLISILRTQSLTLLSPSSWDDKNDSHFMSLYKERRRLSCLAALCFSRATETYHHWRVFAGHSSGVCVQFHTDALLESLSKYEGLLAKPVSYRTLPALRKHPPRIGQLPFVKRAGFKDEKEFRLVFQSFADLDGPVSFEIPLRTIDRIVLSPWLNKALRDHLTHVLKAIPGCNGISIVRSTLVANDEWRAIGDGAA